MRQFPAKILQKFIDVAAYAPSACNIHPVKWVVTADPGKVREFSRAAVAFLKTLPQDHPAADVVGMLITEAGAGSGDRFSVGFWSDRQHHCVVLG